MSSSANCVYPSSLSSCISSCSLAFYNSSVDGLCYPCKSICLTCVTNLYCDLCTDPLCLICPGYSACSQCKNNSTSINGICTCDHGFAFNTTLESCAPITCYEGCYNCNATSIFNCTECNPGLITMNSICLNIPTGYSNTTGVYSTNGALTFSVEFSAILGLMYDSINNIPVLTGNSPMFYPTPDDEDPIPAYLRGYYFDGNASVVRLPVYKIYSSPALILAPTFGVEILLLPSFINGTILYSVSSNSTMFNFYLINEQVVTNITFAGVGTAISVLSNNSLVIGQ